MASLPTSAAAAACLPGPPPPSTSTALTATVTRNANIDSPNSIVTKTKSFPPLPLGRGPGPGIAYRIRWMKLSRDQQASAASAGGAGPFSPAAASASASVSASVPASNDALLAVGGTAGGGAAAAARWWPALVYGDGYDGVMKDVDKKESQIRSYIFKQARHEKSRRLNHAKLHNLPTIPPPRPIAALFGFNKLSLTTIGSGSMQHPQPPHATLEEAEEAGTIIDFFDHYDAMTMVGGGVHHPYSPKDTPHLVNMNAGDPNFENAVEHAAEMIENDGTDYEEEEPVAIWSEPWPSNTDHSTMTPALRLGWDGNPNGSEGTATAAAAGGNDGGGPPERVSSSDGRTDEGTRGETDRPAPASLHGGDLASTGSRSNLRGDSASQGTTTMGQVSRVSPDAENGAALAAASTAIGADAEEDDPRTTTLPKPKRAKMTTQEATTTATTPKQPTCFPPPPLIPAVRGTPIAPHEPWLHVWSKLEYSGWTREIGSGLMTDYYYIKPGGRAPHRPGGRKGANAKKGGVENLDYFCSEEKVREFCRESYGWKSDGGGGAKTAAAAEDTKRRRRSGDNGSSGDDGNGRQAKPTTARSGGGTVKKAAGNKRRMEDVTNTNKTGRARTATSRSASGAVSSSTSPQAAAAASNKRTKHARRNDRSGTGKADVKSKSNGNYTSNTKSSSASKSDGRRRQEQGRKNNKAQNNKGRKGRRSSPGRIWGKEQARTGTTTAAAATATKRKVKKNNKGPATPPNRLKTKPQDPGLPLLSSASSKQRSSGGFNSSDGESGGNSSNGSLTPSDRGYYDFANLWPRLKRTGWTWSKAGRINPLLDWLYVRPGRSVKDGKVKVDYFCSQGDVVDWVKRKDLEGGELESGRRGRGGGSGQRSSNQKRKRTEDATAAASGETEAGAERSAVTGAFDLEADDDKIDDRGEKGESTEDDSSKKALASSSSSPAGQTFSKVQALVAARELAIEGGADKDEKEEEKEESEGEVRAGRKKGSSSPGAAASAAKNANANARSPSSFSPWWQSTPIPTFKATWSILQKKLKFRYVGGVYYTPHSKAPSKGGVEGVDYFGDVEEMRRFLGRSGVPNLDGGGNDDSDDAEDLLLTRDEERAVVRWVSLSSLPKGITTQNSLDLLRSVPSLSSREAWTVLESKLGYAHVKGAYYAPVAAPVPGVSVGKAAATSSQASQSDHRSAHGIIPHGSSVRGGAGDDSHPTQWRSLDELRSYLRDNGLFRDKVYRVGHFSDTSSINLTDEEYVSLVLWASGSPLPTCIGREGDEDKNEETEEKTAGQTTSIPAAASAWASSSSGATPSVRQVDVLGTSSSRGIGAVADARAGGSGSGEGRAVATPAAIDVPDLVLANVVTVVPSTAKVRGRNASPTSSSGGSRGSGGGPRSSPALAAAMNAEGREEAAAARRRSSTPPASAPAATPATASISVSAASAVSITAVDDVNGAKTPAVDSGRKTLLIRDAKARMRNINGTPVLFGDDWRNVWEKMRYTGWEQKVGKGVDTWHYYLPSGISSREGGQPGIDYLTDLDEVCEFAKDHLGWSGEQRGIGEQGQGFHISNYS